MKNACSKKNYATITKKNVTRSGTPRTIWLLKKAKLRSGDWRRWRSGGSRINMQISKSSAASTSFLMENFQTAWPLSETKNRRTCKNHHNHGPWSLVVKPAVRGLQTHLHRGRMLATLTLPAHNLETVCNATLPQISIEPHQPLLLLLPSDLRSEQEGSKSSALSFQSEYNWLLGIFNF
jgi:hypothetical protein